MPLGQTADAVTDSGAAAWPHQGCVSVLAASLWRPHLVTSRAAQQAHAVELRHTGVDQCVHGSLALLHSRALTTLANIRCACRGGHALRAQRAGRGLLCAGSRPDGLCCGVAALLVPDSSSCRAGAVAAGGTHRAGTAALDRLQDQGGSLAWWTGAEVWASSTCWAGEPWIAQLARGCAATCAEGAGLAGGTLGASKPYIQHHTTAGHLEHPQLGVLT